MGTFGIEYTQATPSGRTSGVRANLNLGDSGQEVAEAVAGFGGAMFDEGIRIRTAQDAMALSELNRQSGEMDIALHESLSKMTDEDLQNTLIEEAYAGKEEIARSANPRVSAAFTRNLNNSYEAWKTQALGVGLQARAKDVTAQMEFQLASAYERGDEFGAHKILETAKATGIMSLSEYSFRSKNVHTDSTLASARVMIDRDPITAIKQLSSLQGLSGDNLDKRNRLLNLVEGNLKEQRKIAYEVDKAQLGDALNDGTITYEMIRDTSLGEDAKERYRIKMNTEARRRATGENIATNQSIKGDIESEAYKIWQGAIDKNEYDQILEDARYGNEVDGKLQYVFNGFLSDKPLIDDVAYDELKSLGTREMKMSQAKGLSEASYYAKGQLVVVPDDVNIWQSTIGMGPEDKKQFLDDRVVQLENWAQFNRAMRLWQSEHPDAVEGDYYIESRRKLPFYRNRKEQDVIKGVPSDISNQPPRPSPNYLRKLGTREAYEQGIKLGYWSREE